jgi:hypothetical protein
LEFSELRLKWKSFFAKPIRFLKPYGFKKRLQRIAGNLPAGRQEALENLCTFANKKFLYA